MNNFTFNLDDSVCLKMSQERGQVIGRAEYAEMPPQYFVRYVNAHQCQQEAWFTEGALERL